MKVDFYIIAIIIGVAGIIMLAILWSVDNRLRLVEDQIELISKHTHVQD